jgi:hypothetical protein
VLPSKQSNGLQQIVPVAPALPAATFEVHEAFPLAPQQSPMTKTACGIGRDRSQIVVKRAGSKRDMVTLLGSKSSLRQAILIREILGPPRGLQAIGRHAVIVELIKPAAQTRYRRGWTAAKPCARRFLTTHVWIERKDKRGVDLICDSILFWGEQPPFAPAVWGAVYLSAVYPPV